MRILAIDAGNTRIKWGLHEDGSWRAQGWVATARAASLVRAWARLDRPDAIIVANVAGAPAAAALGRAARRFKRRVRYAKSVERQCGVRNSYDAPGQLGADRWGALIGAWSRHRGACLVVGAGTTLTVDALSADGVFLGGLIVAGADLMRSALARNTAQLRPRGGRFAFFPARTADAIESGAINALAGAIDRMRRYLREAGEDPVLTMLSGGHARMLSGHLNGSVELVDNLVLEGLICIALDKNA